MSATIAVPEALAEKVADFLKVEAVACEVVAGGDATICIVQSEDRQQSDPSTLQAGGWIACEDAFAMASKLGMPVPAMGKLLNLLDVRIRSCQLGCF